MKAATVGYLLTITTAIKLLYILWHNILILCPRTSFIPNMLKKILLLFETFYRLQAKLDWECYAISLKWIAEERTAQGLHMTIFPKK